MGSTFTEEELARACAALASLTAEKRKSLTRKIALDRARQRDERAAPDRSDGQILVKPLLELMDRARQTGRKTIRLEELEKVIGIAVDPAGE